MCGVVFRYKHNRLMDVYNELVKQQILYRQDGEVELEESIYEQAVALYPFAVESYYQHANTLYEQRDYRGCIDFINTDILQNDKVDLLQDRMVDIYYLEADSYFQIEEYESAVGIYDILFGFNIENTQYYRDYAITLAYTGDLKQAEQVLDEAEALGLEDDSLYYARGEIRKAEYSDEEAIEAFMWCIHNSDDDALRKKAYLACAYIYERRKDDIKRREILLEAREELPSSEQLLILEELIAADLALVDEAEEPELSLYRTEAVGILEEVIEYGWATFTTYQNLVVLYEELDDLERAEEVLRMMEKLYGDDYCIYMRYAFLELDKQQNLSNENRDYGDFVEYYVKAKNLYESQKRVGSSSDSEMELLEQLYEQVKEGGWLD